MQILQEQISVHVGNAGAIAENMKFSNKQLLSFVFFVPSWLIFRFIIKTNTFTGRRPE